ncbi:MAG: CHAT domain-containing protein, partial [Phycisphaerales bacterium]|nr:CHAT domain-containing protein [Phycisphaerales bacterium]
VTHAMQRSSHIHCACHGRYDADDPQGSGLQLADRWMTVRDLAELDLNADTVVLSGCETGRSSHAGHEAFGLPFALLSAGARSVFVSLWSVHDEITTEFMGILYRHWYPQSGLVPRRAEGARQAVRAMRIRAPHPAFWAPFVLIGQP